MNNFHLIGHSAGAHLAGGAGAAVLFGKVLRITGNQFYNLVIVLQFHLLN